MNEEIVKKLQDAIVSCSNIPGKEPYKNEITQTLLLLILQEVGAQTEHLKEIAVEISYVTSAIYDLGEHLKP